MTPQSPAGDSSPFRGALERKCNFASPERGGATEVAEGFSCRGCATEVAEGFSRRRCATEVAEGSNTMNEKGYTKMNLKNC